MILAAQDIRARCSADPPLIAPFYERAVDATSGMTYGLSPAGYDICVAETLRMFHGAFLLASSIERFNMPLDLLANVCDKSTWARHGLLVQNTIIEPGWEGYLTLELTYHGEDGLLIHNGTPIAQVVFQVLTQPTDMPYRGKYQNQRQGAVKAVREYVDVPGWAPCRRCGTLESNDAPCRCGDE
jgi:dCTP deaminase